MKLIIHGLDNKFTLDNFSVTKDEMQIACQDLLDFITDEEIAPAPPPPPAEPEYIIVPTAKLNGATIEAYKENGWSEQQLLDHGFVEKQPISEQPAPVAPKSAGMPAGYKMAPKAAGTTFEQWIAKSWSVQDLIEQEYLIKDVPETPEFPYQNENGEWVDSAGVIWDGEKHSMSKAGVPPVTTKGLFKKKRGYVEPTDAPADNTDPNATQAAQDVAPPAPPAPAPAAPTMAAPAAPTAPTAPAAPTVGDDSLDAELENILSDW